VLPAVTGPVGGLTGSTVPAVTGTVTGTKGGLLGGTVPTVTGTAPGGPASPPPVGPQVSAAGAAGGVPGAAVTAQNAAITTPGAPSPGISAPAPSWAPGPSSGATSSRGPGGAGWRPGLTGAGSGTPVTSGGGFPFAPGQPGKNPAPWEPAALPSSPETISGSGSGSGSGLAALLIAVLIVPAGVLWRRRAAFTRPRSAWLRALEVPG
jgi:hypothetical protein